MDDALNVVKEAYAAFQKGDIPAVLARCSEDVSWFLPGDPAAIPILGSRKGVADVAEFFRLLGENQVPEVFEPREFVVQGDRVVALGSYRFRVRKTNRAFSSDFAHSFRVRDGRIASFHEYLDTAAAYEAYEV